MCMNRRKSVQLTHHMYFSPPLPKNNNPIISANLCIIENYIIYASIQNHSKKKRYKK